MKREGLLVGALLLAVFAWTFEPLVVFDLWFYLRMGEEIVTSGSIPHYVNFLSTNDIYPPSYDINPEWGTSVLVYLVHQAFGNLGLVATKALLLTGLAALIYAGARLEELDPVPAVLLTALGMLALRSRFMLRAVLFTDVFLSLLVVLVLLAERGKLKHFAWLMLPLFAIWSNFHQGSISGLILLGAYGFGSLLERKEAPLRPGQLGLAGGLALLGTICRPGGYLLYPWTLEHMRRKLPLDWVLEWEPIGHGWWLTPLGPYVAVAVVAFALATRRRIRWSHLLVCLTYFFFAFRYNRALGELIPVATPLIGAALARGGLRLDPVWGRRLMAALAGTGLILTGVFAASPRRHDFNLSAGLYPLGAVEYLAQHPPTGRIFNSYEYGGFLAWRHLPPFVHGITSIYPDQLLTDHIDILYQDKRAELLDRYQIEVVLMHSPQGAEIGLVHYLYQAPQWQLVYFDDAGLMFWRGKSPTPPFKWLRPGTDQPLDGPPDQLAAELERARQLAPRAGKPIELEAELALSQQQLDRALELCRQGLELHPDYYLFWLKQGAILHRMGRSQEAVTALRQATRFAPDSPIAHFNLAVACVALARTEPGYLAEARRAAHRALELDPGMQAARQLVDGLE
ncbi:MAG: tetratricopeptide repeat protein [Vulcanimicrobiota bacterium]